MSWRSLLRGSRATAPPPGSPPICPEPLPVVQELFDRLDRIDRRLERLEALSHGGRSVYVGDGRIMTKIRLRHWNMAFLLEAKDLLLAPPLVMNGYHEIDLTDYFVNAINETDHCLDIGANFGYFACIMGRWAPRGRVVAVEPDPKIFGLLRDNIYINNLESLASPVNAAASDCEGVLTLHRRVGRSGNTSLARVGDADLARMGEPPSEAFQIRGLPIDALLPEFQGRLDHMKIDVEGAEPLVLRGARETIAANPQLRIVMEWAPGQIQAAGFDPRGFTEELAALGLVPAMIVTAGKTEPMSWDALVSCAYSPGILLCRRLSGSTSEP